MHNIRVAILIQTMNRPDFVIRSLEYYAKLKSPHPVYVGDSSNPENVQKIQSAIARLKNKLEVYYSWCQPGLEAFDQLLPLVKESYAVTTGDDDYVIPSTITRCAEFLENRPDYVAAGGHGVSFRLSSSGPYGQIKRLADYPNRTIEANSASQRLMDFSKKNFVVTFSVNRVDHLRKIFSVPLPIITTWSELFQNSFCAVSGKIKVLDCLGVIRQIHDKQYYTSLMIDWLLEKNFHDSYIKFRDHLAKEIMRIDNIGQEQAENTVKKAFWAYLQVYMASEQKALNTNPTGSYNSTKLIKARIGKTFPFIKKVYRRYFHSVISDNKQMHYEITDPSSQYYKDFLPVFDSFSGKDINKI